MPLIDLKTDLKSLKYGEDRPGGGDSGQPYIQTDINNPGDLVASNLDDGYIRNGFVGAARASAIDGVRIKKLFNDKPKGIEFIRRQILLQQTNPKLEIRKAPDVFSILTGDLSSLFGSNPFASNTLGAALQPTRLYNNGFNTLSQVPVNAFGVHFNRHGAVPVQDDSTKYLAVAQVNNEGRGGKSNRLVGYKNKFELGDGKGEGRGTGSRFLDRLLGFVKQLLPIKFEPKQLTIENYIGGPNSVYGAGNTLIKRYDFTEDSNKILRSRNISATRAGKAYNPNNRKDEGANALDRKVDLVAGGPSAQEYGSTTLARLPRTSPTKTYQQIKKENNNRVNRGVFGFNPFKNTNLGAGGFDFYNGEIKNYTNQNISYNNGIDAKINLNGSWRALNRETRVGSGRRDEINLTPMFNASAGTIGDKVTIYGLGQKSINDLVKFRIQAVNTDNPDISTWMVFRAYLTQFTDNVDAAWNDVKYVGRGESFYIYSGFTRKINIGFKVAALSEQEMKPMYQKLNYLMGNLMPDYSEDGLMRGPLVRMTVGNWIDGQAGILNTLNYTVPQDAPWEIALAEPILGEKKLILPHVIEVNMTFTPIGSQTFKDNKISEKSPGTSHIAQNINDYQYIDEFVPSEASLVKNNVQLQPLATPTTNLSNSTFRPIETQARARQSFEQAQRSQTLLTPTNIPSIVRGGG